MSGSEKALFIGGPWDGERKHMDSADTYTVAGYGGYLATSYHPDMTAVFPAVSVIYKRIQLSHKHVFYVVDDRNEYLMTTLLDALVKGYRNF